MEMHAKANTLHVECDTLMALNSQTFVVLNSSARIPSHPLV